jgi:hypothetical protein
MIIYCGLKDEIEGFTLKDAGRLINAYNREASNNFLKLVLQGKREGALKN